MLNKEKTSIFFNRNTPADIQQTNMKIAGVKSNGSYEKYLGLPGKNKGGFLPFPH